MRRWWRKGTRRRQRWRKGMRRRRRRRRWTRRRRSSSWALGKPRLRRRRSNSWALGQPPRGGGGGGGGFRGALAPLEGGEAVGLDAVSLLLRDLHGQRLHRACASRVRSGSGKEFFFSLASSNGLSPVGGPSYKKKPLNPKFRHKTHFYSRKNRKR